jgi:shikimate dehydrogenase
MKIYGLIGFPLEHSFSQKYFTQKFDKENIRDAEYSLFPLRSIREFPGLIRVIPELTGLNVTIPYKEAVLKYLDETDDTANETGAVNTIKITSKGGKKKLTGFNTDIYGIEKILVPLLNPLYQKALILGTCGAS